VTLLQQITVPSQDRLRPHQQLHATQRLPRQAVEQAREEKPVLNREPRPGTLTLQNRELVPQNQDFGLQLAPGHRQQAYQGERVRDGKVSQTQQHDRPCCPRVRSR
jgi:hypothetical protein